jgi:hypothetical protein
MDALNLAWVAGSPARKSQYCCPFTCSKTLAPLRTASSTAPQAPRFAGVACMSNRSHNRLGWSARIVAPNAVLR